MSKYINFKSTSEINLKREENREAREQILESAKRKYEAEQARAEKAKKQGEGTWMLDSVSLRIQHEEKSLSKAKKKKKKKEKKAKKKHKRKDRSNDSSSEDSDSGEESWVEKSGDANDVNSSSASVKGPQLQRESWMEAPIDLIPSISKKEIRDEAIRKKEEARREAEKMLEPGQHAKELNPHWQNGGTGLPGVEKSKLSSKPSQASGDGGVSWLRKALKRCEEQAEEEGRNIKEVAAERWGSLEKLKTMLRDAEEAQGLSRRNYGQSCERNFGNRKDDWNRNRGREREQGDAYRDRLDRRSSSREKEDNFKSRENRNLGDGKKPRMPLSDGRGQMHQRKSHQDFKRPNSDSDGEHDDKSRHKKHSNEDDRRSGSRQYFRRPGSDSDDEQRSYSKHRKPFKKEDSSSQRSHQAFKRPGSESDDEQQTYSRQEKRSLNEVSRPQRSHQAFKRPGSDSDDDQERYSQHKKSSKEGEERAHRDGKRGVRERDHENSNSSRRFARPGELSKRPSSSRSSDYRDDKSSVPRWKKKTEKDIQAEERREKEKEMSKSRSPSSSGTDSSGSRSDEESMEQETSELKSEPSQKIMSEEEMNELAAKILRAEIMGDEDFVAELKARLEAARKARDSSKTDSAPDFAYARVSKKENPKEEQEDSNVVVLSRTTKGGLVRPIVGMSSENWGGGRGKKQKKKKNVATHSGMGDRTIYFDDDNKFDLKALVEREKAGTAEDQNSMFARLAGRANDRDLDVDDIFVSKAAQQQSSENAEKKDRAAAIFEHRKINAAMEKCQHCFNKVAKHLIIAIGAKSYLCLPPHRSLTEGHCLIVPMTHVASATSMDEDVWQEMQLFRKTLVNMFAEQDQDIVFMETVMHLKHFPHTTIECVPLEKETGDLSPIYFKKAIQEAGPEWSDNKKLHDISKKDIRHVIPKGFPYFSVDFGLQGGFAHVIEDEAMFQHYFGREIVGGMIDAEPNLWRKPQKQNFEEQRQKVLQFEEWWAPHDWTKNM